MLHELLAKTWGRSGFEAFIRRLQGQYARQAAVAAAAADAQLAGLAEWRPACAGMFMWFKLTGRFVWVGVFGWWCCLWWNIAGGLRL
jgi:DNA-binding transcriptional MocR family regulator